MQAADSRWQLPPVADLMLIKSDVGNLENSFIATVSWGASLLLCLDWGENMLGLLWEVATGGWMSKVCIHICCIHWRSSGAGQIELHGR